MALQIKLPVREDGVHIDEPTSLTPEQIEAKRLADEAAASKVIADKAEADRLAAEAEKNKVKTPEQLEAERLAAEAASKSKIVDDQKIIIDDVEYSLNTTGDVLKSDGTIHMTKAELDKLNTVADEPDADDPITIIQEVLNFKPEENGKPVVYERTKAGLTKLTLDAATKIGQQLAQQELDAYFEANPDVAQRRAHKILNGSLDGFVEEANWASLNIETLTDDQLANLITHERLTKGDSEAMAKYFVDGLKKDGKLKEFAPQSVAYLDARQKQTLALAKQVEESKKAANDKMIQEYWQGVDNSLASKKIIVNGETFELPSSFQVKEAEGKTVIKTIKDFDAYIKKPLPFVIDGKTEMLTQNQFDILVEESRHNSDTDIFNALRRFLHYDDSQLIKAKAQAEQVKQIRKYITKSGAKSENKVDTPLKLNLPVK